MKIFNGPGSGERVFYRMEKKANKEADIYFYDVIGDDWNGTTAKSFSAELRLLDKPDVLNVFINSPGGSVRDGVAIYNILVRHPARKNVQVDGLAGSIASVVAMCGNQISIAKNAMFMIHNPWSIVMGEAKDFRQQADILDQIRETILVTYVDRAKASEKQFSDWMDSETWFSAEESVAAGLADRISESEMNIAAIAGHDFSKFKNMPQQFRELLTKVKVATIPAQEIPAAQIATPGGLGKPHPHLVKTDVAMQRLRLERAKP